ncbi:hypothetical protein JQX09_22400 [Sulfitobacter pseudonitzschiae]|uniref:Uncharacterized protein n=1 Tax=Pseudosulfitobacter pseudonitzschiae TaxID=1402135 RepID=A0A9Q2NTA3_9RHOB|nr:hypothetical protein [Pseudosulfitobacter pseudonitzschiae]MBM2294712.1 hypothetical protein [Pseudosulfitobacter pseudonitzschiae]MBM2299649.1 hypothetical protein [Pseudosulfitobacter pseudonitzschiae]MBM2304514.1 hypothetical protein [Pseudosulfitobacter pseudonitzschiae]MBM2314323.1 hypothetical protein [Pseudosulfitobacter pseudonitzschiae]MBM2319205.1 hypothetical protein [Pseudosulfitobacter pseudonitzschiae]
MRELSTAISQFLQSRGPRHAHLMVWIEARNRETGQAETIGFWTGADHTEIAIGGVTRTYFGAGTLLSMSPLIIEAGLNVRTSRLHFSKVAPEVQVAVRGYETREAPTEVHVAYFDALTHQLIDAPVRVFKGRITGLKMTRPKKGDPSAICEVSMQTTARALTKTLALKKSNAALLARAPSDQFRDAADISGAIETVWGEIRAKGPGAASGGSGTTDLPIDRIFGR